MNQELKDNGYTIIDAPEVDLASIADSFDRLPVDQYLRSGVRSRRFSWFAGTPADPVKLPHKLFYQTEKYEGRPDIHRQFDEIDSSTYSSSAFKNLLEIYVRVTGINMANTPIEAHQLRISSGGDLDGDPSPEGVHRDGCHFLGIFVVQREGVVGGETSVHENKTDGPVHSSELQPGQFLFVDDERLMHHALPMTAAVGFDRAHWDIIVFTAGEHRRSQA